MRVGHRVYASMRSLQIFCQSSSTEIGSRSTNETHAYKNFMPKAVKWMKETLVDGQNPAEVAEVISSVIASENRQFRYQTSSKGILTVANRHCDPTGEKSIREQESLIKQLWKGSLDIHTGSSCR